VTSKLTPKQEKAATKYVECGDKSKAYRFAYNTENMKPESVWRKAVELFENVKVTARVKELQSEHRERHDITVDGLTGKYIDVYNMAVELNIPGAAVSALNSLAKLHGLIVERGTIQHEGKITHDHQHRPVSDTLRFIEGALGRGEEGSPEKSLPY